MHTDLPLTHGSGPPCNNGDIHLVDGQDEFHGRVEMCNEGEWKTVRDVGWGIKEAKVVCRQRGYPNIGKGLLILVFGMPSKLNFTWPLIVPIKSSPAGNKIMYRSRLWKNH